MCSTEDLTGLEWHKLVLIFVCVIWLQVTEESRRAQFLIPVDADGQNQAQASLERAQLLNPMVEVKADTDAVESKPDDFFFQFDAVSPVTSRFNGVICRFYITKSYTRPTGNLMLWVTVWLFIN